MSGLRSSLDSILKLLLFGLTLARGVECVLDGEEAVHGRRVVRAAEGTQQHIPGQRGRGKTMSSGAIYMGPRGRVSVHLEREATMLTQGPAGPRSSGCRAPPSEDAAGAFTTTKRLAICATSSDRSIPTPRIT
jgi:hypothetical protein